MTILRAFLLGALQGATEFLPISSSGHLVLVPWLLRWPSPGLAYDTAVHWGTALAIVAYFRRDWSAILQAASRVLQSGLRSIRRRLVESSTEAGVGAAIIPEPEGTPAGAAQDTAGPNIDPGMWQRLGQARMVWLLLLGTLPAAVIGYALEDFFEETFSKPVFSAVFLLVTSALLFAAERRSQPGRDLNALTWSDALSIGFGQALAIFPGLSRSGATIATGILRGLGRTAAARFSFLLATPIILGAGLFKLVDLAQGGGLVAQYPALVVGSLTAATVGYGCIYFLMHYLQNRRLYPFAAYCAIAGVACVLVALARTA